MAGGMSMGNPGSMENLLIDSWRQDADAVAEVVNITKMVTASRLTG